MIRDNPKLNRKGSDFMTNTTKKAIYFDMDGTLAALFFVKGYSEMLANNDTTPYTIARPLFKADEMKAEIERLKALGYVIGVISYYGKDSNNEMIKATRKAKKEWLNNYFPYADETHIINPNTKKKYAAKIKNSYLVDDSRKNREEWGEKAINGHFRKNFMEELKKITE